MSDKPQQTTASDEITPDTRGAAPQLASENKEKDLLAPEDGRKGQGSLPVPSRSSSQRNQSSPTTTGLSGATANESRHSIGGRSKESKSSILGRHRNGSVSSRRSGNVTGPTTTPGQSQPNSPTNPPPPPQRKKKGGLLSLLGCCGVPDNAQNLEGQEQGVHKLAELPARPTTAKSRQPTPQKQPDQPSSSRPQLQEKQPQPEQPMTTASSADQKGKRVSSTTAVDDVPAAESSAAARQVPAAAAAVAAPTITVEGSNGTKSEAVAPDGESKDADGDEAMPDVVPTEDAADEKQSAADPQTTQLPPPPPGPAPTNNMPPVPVVEDADSISQEPQKWLLPPIAPEFKGKKCLVLDLDETLVHSSFKVSSMSATVLMCTC